MTPHRYLYENLPPTEYQQFMIQFNNKSPREKRVLLIGAGMLLRMDKFSAQDIKRWLLTPVENTPKLWSIELGDYL